jgi:proteasome accessory factor B
MAASRQERLVNLVICLLASRQFLTAERIRDMVPGYDESPSEEAFKRTFERDKAQLRDLGVPLEVGEDASGTEGYRISEGDYELPPIEFDASEAAVIGLAARFWRSAELGEAASTALLKLKAAGIDFDTPHSDALPTIESADPNVGTLVDAARDTQAVRFRYRKAGAPEVETRTLEPWGLPFWHGRWYVVGYDRDRGEPRSFRLSRIEGDVRTTGAKDAFVRPVDVDLVDLVSNRGPEKSATAHVQVTGEGAGQLRRIADADVDGVLTIAYNDLGALARQVAAAGASALVLQPAELAEAVRARLSLVMGAAEAGAVR